VSDPVYITWLGDGLDGCPPAVEWCGVVFRTGEPVAIDDPHMIAKARNNRTFRVEFKTDDNVFVSVPTPTAPVYYGPPAPPLSEQIEVLAKRGPGRPRKVVPDAGH
jgi:hypothetical protein